jgi:hypothetical protein
MISYTESTASKLNSNSWKLSGLRSAGEFIQSLICYSIRLWSKIPTSYAALLNSLDAPCHVRRSGSTSELSSDHATIPIVMEISVYKGTRPGTVA